MCVEHVFVAISRFYIPVHVCTCESNPMRKHVSGNVKVRNVNETFIDTYAHDLGTFSQSQGK